MSGQVIAFPGVTRLQAQACDGRLRLPGTSADEFATHCPECYSTRFNILAPKGRIFCAGCQGEIHNWRVGSAV